MSGDGVAVRAYRVLVTLYPRRFRNEYGPDMVAMFRDQCRDESVWRASARAGLDLAISIPTQRLEATMHGFPRTLVPLMYLAIALAGLVTAIMGGTDPTTIVLGLAVALVAGAVGVVAWRRRATASATTLTGSWWKFLVSGPGLVVVVIIAAALGVEAWFLGMMTLLLALVLTTIGVGLGVSHLLIRRRPQDPPMTFSSGT